MNLTEMLGVKVGLLVGAIKLVGLTERGENQMVERLADIFKGEKTAY